MAIGDRLCLAVAETTHKRDLLVNWLLTPVIGRYAAVGVLGCHVLNAPGLRLR